MATVAVGIRVARSACGHHISRAVVNLRDVKHELDLDIRRKHG